MAPILSRVSSDFGFGKRTAAAGPSFSATGGTVTSAGITPGNGYRYHVFTSPGTFTVNNGSTTGEVLIVAGGGGGGAVFDGVGGGGGAGGVVYYTTYPFTSPIPITTGSGGPGTPSAPNGGNTVFGSTTALGGGIGGQSRRGTIYAPPTGNPGGSGGGGNGFDNGKPGGSATQPGQPLVAGAGGTNYGTIGGNGSTYAGGGGGSGAAGNNHKGPSAGDGGNGQPFPGFAGPLISPEIPAPNVPVIGPLGYYAGGGGGGGQPSPVGAGGLGGGASGGGAQGDSATGYGSGGAGSHTGPLTPGGSGSPGIVIVRYLV